MGRTSRVRSGLLTASLLVAGAAPAWAGMTLMFAVDNAQYSPSDVYVMFGGAETGLTGNIIGGGPIALGQSYSMAELASGVDLIAFNSGRIFVSLGQPLTSPSSANGYAPNFSNSLLPDYTTRWDKVEISFSNGTGGADLTASDFFSVPLQLTASGGGVPSATLQWNAATATALQAVGKLSNFSLTQPNGVFYPYGAIVTGPDGVPIPGVNQPVVRIINPSTVTSMPDGTTVYPSFGAYLNYIKINAVSTTIAGSNATAADPQQTYSFAATIANSSYTIAGASISPGDLVFTGTVSDGHGGVVPTTFFIPAANLTDSSVYGANAAFTIVDGADTNGVIRHAVADYLSALNFGLIGSNEPNPNDPGQTIGNSPSWTWYGTDPDGTTSPKLPISDAFSAAQPNDPYYNQVADYLVGITDAYGFPYNDRLELPLLALADDTTLTITVQSDGVGASESEVPEPSTWRLMAGGIVMLLAARRARRRTSRPWRAPSPP